MQRSTSFTEAFFDFFQHNPASQNGPNSATYRQPTNFRVVSLKENAK